MCGFQRDAIIVSYGRNKNKIVTLLSTMHKHKGENSENKPGIILYYNSTKGGRDDMDQMVRYYSIKRMTPKWPMVALFNNDCDNYMDGTSNFSAMPKRCPPCLLITFAKQLA